MGQMFRVALLRQVDAEKSVAELARLVETRLGKQTGHCGVHGSCIVS